MKGKLIAAALAGCLALPVAGAWADGESGDGAAVERGRYLVRITGCNDCHTAGYAAAEGALPESEWLLGDTVGWQGPWGTTYAPNLRLSLSRMTADEWVAFARNLRSRPPMPSFSLHQMTEDDLRDIYAFIRSLQPLGEPGLAYVPPGQTAPTPVVVFPSMPQE